MGADEKGPRAVIIAVAVIISADQRSSAVSLPFPLPFLPFPSIQHPASSIQRCKMPLEDKQLALKLRRQIAHFSVDISQVDVSVRANIVYLTGVLKRLPREQKASDIRKVLDHIVEALQQDRNVRDVVTTYLRVVD
jgi:hypothetical protein